MLGASQHVSIATISGAGYANRLARRMNTIAETTGQPLRYIPLELRERILCSREVPVIVGFIGRGKATGVGIVDRAESFGPATIKTESTIGSGCLLRIVQTTALHKYNQYMNYSTQSVDGDLVHNNRTEREGSSEG